MGVVPAVTAPPIVASSTDDHVRHSMPFSRGRPPIKSTLMLGFSRTVLTA